MKILRLFLCLALTAATHASNNILLIIADDYGIDSSALYNTSPSAALAPTPNIAALAAAGVRFTAAYACPTCSPSRSAMLTGRFGFRTGTGDVVSAAAANSLTAAEFTLPEAFAANGAPGYELKHFGKWHLTAGTGQSVNMSPCTVGGWPAFTGTIAGALASYTDWPKVVSNGTPLGTSTTAHTATYATTDTVNEAVSWIQTQAAAGKPWFAWVALNAPHTPFHLPTPTSLCPHYTTLSGTPADISAQPAAYYAAAVEAMDTEIGRLLATVDFAKTTVIFLGDNGTPAQVLQPPLPSGHGKDTLYEGGVRVPLIIRGPDVIAPGRTAGVLTHVVDLYSTILELAGISAPAGVTLDSQSLLPVLKNQTLTRTRLYSEQFDTSLPATGGRILRDDRYKLIRNRAATEEFYDLQSDPNEATNLIAGGVSAMTSTRQTFYYRLRFDIGRYTAAATPPVTSSGLATGSFSIAVAQNAGATQSLWRCTDLPGGYWAPPPGATSVLSGTALTFTDPAPPGGAAFYSVLAETP